MSSMAGQTQPVTRPSPRKSVDWSEWRRLGLFAAVFLGAWFVPYGSFRVQGAIAESLAMTQEYARQHVLLCLVPALFIAGAIGVFVSQAAVMQYLGPGARRVIAYPVAAVSGTILAVCSCTVLPLFSGIHKRGAGLGPAIAFLYSGPAINVLAIILTARVLGLDLGVARAVLAIGFSILIGLVMHWLFRSEESRRTAIALASPPAAEPSRSLAKTAVYFGLLVGILVFANWSAPSPGVPGAWNAIGAVKWPLTFALLLGLGFVLLRWFRRGELSEWTASTWDFAKQILPLLFVGVLVAGLLLGRPGHEGLIPSDWVAGAVGGNSFRSNLLAAVFGAFMYFATLTEVPIVQGLMGSGMGKGPALALLLAGPALSLPSMLVIRSVLGTRQTATYVALVIAFSTAAGLLFGTLS
jgi:hypothetical protein